VSGAESVKQIGAVGAFALRVSLSAMEKQGSTPF